MSILLDDKLHLSDLLQGLPGVSPARGAEHSEACLVCLDSQNHVTGVEMAIEGSFQTKCYLHWKEEITEQIQRSWLDETEATEAAACGIAFLLILKLTEYTVIERSRKGTGFDYFLGFRNSVELFDHAARLEISGLRHAVRKSEINQRVKDKIKQTDISDDGGLPAFIVVVEFGRPISRVVKK